MQIIRDKTIPIIKNRNNFLVKDIPKYHPSSIKFLKYWKQEKKRCIEGYWGVDDGINCSPLEIDNIDIDRPVEYRYMPGKLYFYVNYGTIKHRPDYLPKTAPKIKIRPYLRDFEWAYYYIEIEARGFSGFTEDKEYSCNRFLLDDYTDEELIHMCLNQNGERIDIKHFNFFKEDGSRKEYIDAREYIRRTFNKPMGLPVYENEASNFMLLGARGGGKSFLTANTIVHEWLFDGAKYYTEQSITNPAVAEILVGAAIASKSSEILSKVADMVEELPGKYSKDSVHPLYKEHSGTLSPNNFKNPFRHEYEKKIAGKWKKLGSKSKIYHATFTVENPEAAAGTRPGLIIVEEVGLAPNILTVHGCYGKDTKIRMYDGSLKNVQDLNYNDIILGHDGTKRTIKNIFNGKDDLYKIKQVNGNEYIVNSKHKLYLEQYANEPSDGLFLTNAEIWFNNKANISDRRRKKTYTLKSGEIDFNRNIDLKLDPYFMGLWLGDGIVKSSGVCYDPKTDINTQEWLINYYKSLGLEYSLRDIKGAILCSPVSKSPKQSSNIIRNELKNYNTLNKKFLHSDFMFSSKKERLKLLAGLIDSDGTLGINGKSYVFYQSGRPDMIDKIEFIARSLGFRVSTCTHVDKRKKYYKKRQQITITGDIYKIPCKHKRKQTDQKEKRSPVRSSFSIEKLGKGNYYGFELNEDFRFLGQDNRICENSNEAAQMTDGVVKFGTSIYIGTGGNVEKIIESELIFRDPKGFSMLEFNDIWEGNGKIGWFVPAYYMDGNYKDKNGNTNLADAIEVYEKRRAEKKKSKSSSAIDLEMMNYPLKPSEMFINKLGNRFSIADLKQQLVEVQSNKKDYADKHWYGELTLTTKGEVKFKPVESNNVVHDYPVLDNKNKSGCIEIFEMPKRNSENNVFPNRYYLGTDTYDDDDSNTNSLGSILVMDAWTKRIVAEYTGRRGTREFYEITRKLTLFYNGVNNYENNKKGLFWHYEKMKSLNILAETPESLRDEANISIRRTGNTRFGTPATVGVNKYAIQLIEMWLDEQAAGKIEGITNIQTIRSIGLLKELISYNPDPNYNFDRISALGMLLIIVEDNYKVINSGKENDGRPRKDITKDPFFEKNWSKSDGLNKLNNYNINRRRNKIQFEG